MGFIPIDTEVNFCFILNIVFFLLVFGGSYNFFHGVGLSPSFSSAIEVNADEAVFSAILLRMVESIVPNVEASLRMEEIPNRARDQKISLKNIHICKFCRRGEALSIGSTNSRGENLAVENVEGAGCDERNRGE